MATNRLCQQTKASQNRIESFAFVIAVGVSILLSFYFAASSGFAGSVRAGKIELDSLINPNAAPVASLIRLPGIGIGRAAAIVAYRNSLAEQKENNPAFQNCDDLRKVKGIGPKTLQNIREWLKFEQ